MLIAEKLLCKPVFCTLTQDGMRNSIANNVVG